MLHVLRIPAYATLFSAQVIALVGTGPFTVALGPLAFRIADNFAGGVLDVRSDIPDHHPRNPAR